MTGKLFLQAVTKFLLGAAVTAALLFIPAGTLSYPGGWLLMGILFVPMFFAGIVMMVKDPELLKKRLNARERQREQRTVIALSGLMFILGFAAAGLSFRLGWLLLPDYVSWAAAVLFLLAYLMYAQVLRENAYLSRTVEVQEGQRVIDTGLYGVVRHPMYTASILLFMSMPLVLGSLISLAVFLMYPVLIVKRIGNEEKLLEAELQGYAEYKKRIKYRLVPYIW